MNRIYEQLSEGKNIKQSHQQYLFDNMTKQKNDLCTFRDNFRVLIPSNQKFIQKLKKNIYSMIINAIHISNAIFSDYHFHYREMQDGIVTVPKVKIVLSSTMLLNI